MSNTSSGLANRGSKLCMQICVNNVTDDYYRKNISRKSRKHLLDDLIGLGEICWLSPLAVNAFKEYELKNIVNEYPDKTGLDDMEWSFWAKKQPQWDAIGITPDSSIIIVEAKSHITEVIKYRKKEDVNIQNVNTIHEVLDNNPLWLTKYYQIANRLVFLDKIKDHFKGSDRKVYLVFLYFIDDVSLEGTTNKKVSRQEWTKFLKKLYH